MSRRGLLMASCMLAVGLLISGASRWPAGPSKGGPIEPRHQINDSEHQAPSRLRLATFNLHSCVGRDNRYDPARAAALLRGYDLASLHEVRGSGPWWKNNAREIGDELDVRSMFAPTEIWWWHRWFGDALLTRMRIDHWETTPLPCGFRDAYRQVVFLKVPFGSGTLNVLMTHLGKNDNRRKQFPIVAEMFLKLPSPAVLMGDLNMRANDPMMQELLRHPGIEDPVGRRMTKPRDRVDFILVKGLHWTDAGLMENVASDHPLIWVEIQAP